MKNILVLLTFLLLNVSVFGQAFYYGANGVPISLASVPNKFTVKFNDGEIDTDLFSEFQVNFTTVTQGNTYFIIDDTTNISSISSDYTIYPVCKVDDVEMLIPNEIMLQFKSTISQVDKDALISTFGLQLIQKSTSFELYQSLNSLNDANAIFESDLVKYAVPNFHADYKLTAVDPPNDLYFEKQFYLDNQGQEINDGQSGKSGADIKILDAWGTLDAENKGIK